MISAASVTALSKAYDGVIALDGVDLEVRAGEVHGLLGPNGAGKTTLLRVLLGLVRPDAGVVTVLGEPRRPGVPLTGLAGFVDAPRAWPYLTGRRTLELLARLDGDGAAHRVDEVLAQVGLTERCDSKVGGWSTGMRQRLGLAGALLRRPRLLVLDEPTSGLDPAGVESVHDLLRSLAADGTAVLLSSHDMGEVTALCERVTVLARGEVRYSGTLSDLRPRTASGSFELSTTDDGLAAEVAAALPGLQVARSRRGLRVEGVQSEVDALVLALADKGVPVRALRSAVPAEVRAFLELTA